MRTLAVMNQKGGTGKTTTSVTLACTLAHRHVRTLLVDLDPQGHAGLAMAVPERRIEATIAEVLSAPAHAQREVTARASWDVRPHLTLVPSGPSLAALEAGSGGMAHTHGRERTLRAWLESIRDRYDVCIIDCSPSIGLLTFNALVASCAVLVPIETAYFAMRGAERQAAMIEAICRRTGHDIETWVLPTMHVPGETTPERILTLLQQRFRRNVAPTPVRRDPAVAEAATLGVPITEHKPHAPAARDYEVLTDWVQGRLPTLPLLHPYPSRDLAPSEPSRSMNRAAELASRAQDMTAKGPRSDPMDPSGRLTEYKHAPPADPGRAISTEGRVGGADLTRPGGTDG